MPTYRPMARRLESERLTLREWSVEDATWNRDLLAERGDGVPTIGDVHERIRRQLEESERTGIRLLVAERKTDGDVVGYSGLVVGRASVDEPEIAYELFRRAHGNGYATEAAKAVLHAAAATGRTRLWATVRSWNAPSLRVLDRLGFVRDHVTEDGRGEVVWWTRSVP